MNDRESFIPLSASYGAICPFCGQFVQVYGKVGGYKISSHPKKMTKAEVDNQCEGTNSIAEKLIRM